MLYSSSSAEHSIGNKTWSHSKLNLCNEGEDISFAITFISGFHILLLFSSWTLHLLLCSLFMSLHGILLLGCQIGEEHPSFLFHCNIHLGSSLVEEEIHEATDCLLQFHIRTSARNSFTAPLHHSRIFSLELNYHSSFIINSFPRRAFFLTSIFYLT